MLGLGNRQPFRAGTRRLLLIGGATACATALVAVPAGAATPREARAARANPRALHLENVAVGLINSVVREVRDAHPACALQNPFEPPTTTTDAAPSKALQDAFAPLRRPATPEDALPDGIADLHLSVSGVYTNWIRVLHGPGGHDYYLILAQHGFVPRPEPRVCLRLQRRDLERRLVGRRPALRRMTLRIFDQVNRSEHPLHPRKPAEAIFLFDRTPTGQIGGGGGGVDLSFVRKNGMVGTDGVSGSSLVTVLVPDGVSSITATFARTVSRGPYRAPKVYPAAITTTVPVQDNVAAFTVARPAPDAFPTRMVWHAPDGSIVKTVRLKL